MAKSKKEQTSVKEEKNVPAGKVQQHLRKLLKFKGAK